MSRPKAPKLGFLEELKRRRVIRVAGVYVVAGWLLVQAAETLFPLLLLPDWAARGVAALVILGFPVALGLAWAFDVTPTGVQRARSRRGRSAGTAPTDAAATDRRRAPAYIAIGMVIAIAALGAYATIGGHTSPRVSGEAIRSIAVLPFVNVSGNADDEYFSDGITEELLNVLAQLPELHVAARTSSFSFKGRNVPIPEVGGQLQVQAVLEGSVRRDGERLRITAQLIDVETGYHLWSEAYDREPTSVFAIQDEIAAAIADALRVRLAGGDEDAAPSTTVVDLAAHDFYLLGLQHWHRRTGPDVLRALELFQSAVEHDPQYARAHAGVALAYAVVTNYTNMVPVDDARRLGREAAYRALSLDPTLAEAHAALGQIAQNYDWDLAESERANRRAIELNPNFATAHQWLGETLSGLGRWDEAWAALETALRLDPLSALMMNIAGFHHYLRGDEGEAEVWLVRSAAAAPDYGVPLEILIWIQVRQGRYDEAIATEERRPGNDSETRDLRALIAGLRDPAARPRAVRLVLDMPPRVTNASWLVRLGEPERALDLLESLPAGSDPHGTWMAVDAGLRPLHGDPRWHALMVRHRLPTSVPL